MNALAFLAFGTLWFWVSAVILFCIIATAVELESGFWATAWFLAGVLGLSWVCKWSILTTIKIHPVAALLWFGMYLVIGVAWSIIKWYFYLRKEVVKYNDKKAEFLHARNAREFTPALSAEFRSSMNSWGITKEIPQARQHKGDLTRWSAYWPFSMLGTVLNDFVRKMYEHIYEYLQTTYQRMADSMFKGVEEDNFLARSHHEQRRS